MKESQGMELKDKVKPDQEVLVKSRVGGSWAAGQGPQLEDKQMGEFHSILDSF